MAGFNTLSCRLGEEISVKDGFSMEKLKQIMEDAECVLIGIGSEFGREFLDKELFQIYTEKKKQTEEVYDWLLPFIRGEVDVNEQCKKYLQAYQQIFELVKNKNYFVITLNQDDIILNSSFDKGKITAPCGSYQRLQCSNGCEESMVQAEESVAEIIEQLKDAALTLEDITRPTCERCGAPLVFNVVEEKNYMEEGYMKSWEKYKMWLIGTLNRKLCLLELGVDFRYPSIIRWAFEKVAFLNEKAVLVRINEKYPQLTEELKGKAYSYHVNSVDFFYQSN
ncbi:MAG: hypothetical protein K2M46_10135 [Lachnospiraceae bacterium]|nr:hypothetical protein [Lachnospiraceae bacterium]